MQLAGAIKEEPFGGEMTPVDEILKQRKEKPEVRVENFDNG